MKALGRRGGLVGGRARARALSRARRVAIAREAARSRWSQPALVIDRSPRDHGELLSFVAHYGSTVARTTTRCSVENVVVRALEAGRRDPALARMLPVLLWRARGTLDMRKLLARARKRGLAPALGYFLELTARLGSWRGFDAAVRQLRVHARPGAPEYYFHQTARNPFEAMAAEERTPVEARRWGLLTGTPTDSFESHFRKTAGL